MNTSRRPAMRSFAPCSLAVRCFAPCGLAVPSFAFPCAMYIHTYICLYMLASLALSAKVLVKVLRDAYGLQDRSRHKASSEATAHPESAAGTRPLFGGNGPSGIFSSRR